MNKPSASFRETYSPYSVTLKLTRTGANDKHGKPIYLHDRVRKYVGIEYFEGPVVFENCAFRIKIEKGFSGEKVTGEDCLKYNYSLLWDEVGGTEKVEKIRQ